MYISGLFCTERRLLWLARPLYTSGLYGMPELIRQGGGHMSTG